jgi:hypothetical protein
MHRGLQHLEAGFDEYESGYLGTQDINKTSAIPARF